VALDVFAFTRILQSDLPVAIYPVQVKMEDLLKIRITPIGDCLIWNLPNKWIAGYDKSGLCFQPEIAIRFSSGNGCCISGKYKY
jgi:hypothetical protein